MFKVYSRAQLGFLYKKCIPPLSKNHVEISRALIYRADYKFSFQNQPKESDPAEQVIITEQELIDAQYFRKKTFGQRNKFTFGIFASGLVSSFAGFPLVATTLYTASFISLCRAEKLGLKAMKFYQDLKGVNAQKYENLNNLLQDHMLKNEELSKFINKETLVIMNMDLKRRSHVENRFFKHDSYEAVQRKYNYTVNFFDIGTGAEGKIKSECVYNYDKDYYFRLINIQLVKPTEKYIKIEDNRNTIDI